MSDEEKEVMKVGLSVLLVALTLGYLMASHLEPLTVPKMAGPLGPSWVVLWDPVWVWHLVRQKERKREPTLGAGTVAQSGERWDFQKVSM
jgi:hypothetical protein